MKSDIMEAKEEKRLQKNIKCCWKVEDCCRREEKESVLHW